MNYIRSIFSGVFGSTQQKELEEIKKKQKKQKTCNVCYQDYNYKNILCKKCNICSSCLDNWFASQIKTQQGDPYTEVKTTKLSCPSCKRNIQLQEVESHQQKFTQTLTNLSELFLKKEGSYFSCPSGTCKNIGWISSTDCKEDFTCSECNYKWKNPNKWTFGKMISKLFSISEMMTRLFKWFFTKPCPHCKVPIQKNGGCKNMHCSNCKKSFCWLCNFATHYNFSFLCFFICIFRAALFLVPLNYMISLYGTYDYIFSGISMVFSMEQLVFELGFLKVFYFFFRVVYQVGLVPLIFLLFCSRSGKLGIFGVILIDLVCWYFFTRWIEILYVALFAAQIGFTIFFFMV